LDDEDEDLLRIKDDIINDAASKEEAELKQLEKSWSSGSTSTTVNGQTTMSSFFRSSAAVSGKKTAAAATTVASSSSDDSAYEPLACPRGYMHDSKGECVRVSSSTVERNSATCGVNMVFASGSCKCRRGFHLAANKVCKKNKPQARLCNQGWFYYRGGCVRTCPKPFAGDAITRHCIIPSDKSTQPARCGKNMTLTKSGFCKCRKGFRHAVDGSACIRYVKKFTTCRPGYYLLARKCVKTCPAPLLPENKSRRCLTKDQMQTLEGKYRNAKALALQAAALARKRARALFRARVQKVKKATKVVNKRALAAAAALRRARARVAALEKQITMVKAHHWTKNNQLHTAVIRAKYLASSIVAWKLRLTQAKRSAIRIAALIKHLRKVHKRLSALERAKARALAKAKGRAVALATALAADRARAMALARKLADLKAKALLDAMRRARAAARAKARALARRRAAELARAMARANALARAQALARRRAAQLARQQNAALARARDLAARRRQAISLARARAAELRRRQLAALRNCRDKAALRQQALAAARRLAAAQMKSRQARLRALHRSRDLARAKARAASRAVAAARARAAYLRQLRNARKSCHPVRGCPALTRAPRVRRRRVVRKVARKVRPAAPKTRKVLVKCRRGYKRHGLFCVPLEKKQE